MLKKIQNCFAFLTRIPLKKDINLSKDVAPHMWFFPIVGFCIGLILSVFGLFFFNFLPFLIVGFILLGILLFITGVHHADGLLDFGDGIMVIGSPERKIEVMHDVSIGAGGFSLGFIIFTLTGVVLSYSMDNIIIILIFSEVGAKFNMVAACSIGKSANTKMADDFIKSNKKSHLIFSLILSLILITLALILTNLYNIIKNYLPSLNMFLILIKNVSILNWLVILSLFIVFFIGTAIPLLIILYLANKNFNGLTGDCLGALNEVTRLFILILMMVFKNIIIL